MSFSLRELEAFFVKREMRVETWSRVRPEVWETKRDGPWRDEDFYQHTGEREHHVEVDTLVEADGLWLLCPKCFIGKDGPQGVHSILCWFVGHVPDDTQPMPGRWVPSGTGLDDLTFVGPAAASIQLTSGCRAHFFVRNGRCEDIT